MIPDLGEQTYGKPEMIAAPLRLFFGAIELSATHVGYTAVADRRSDRLAAPGLVGVVIGQRRVERGERVDRVRACEGACQVVGVAYIAGDDLSVTEVCFAGGCVSLGTFSTHFTQLIGVPPSVYRRQAARATAGLPPCVAKMMTRPIRNREARVTEPQLV